MFAIALPPVDGAVEARDDDPDDDPSSDDDSQAKANVLENEHFLENGEEDSSSDEESYDVPQVKAVLHGQWHHA